MGCEASTVHEVSALLDEEAWTRARRGSFSGARTRGFELLFRTGPNSALVVPAPRERMIDGSFDLVRGAIDGLVERGRVV